MRQKGPKRLQVEDFPKISMLILGGVTTINTRLAITRQISGTDFLKISHDQQTKIFNLSQLEGLKTCFATIRLKRQKVLPKKSTTLLSLKTSFQIRIETYVARVSSPQAPPKPRLRRVSITAVLTKYPKSVNRKRKRVKTFLLKYTSQKLVCCQIL